MIYYVRFTFYITGSTVEWYYFDKV